MSANRGASAVGAELERQGLALLHQAREVRDLDSGQVERIARRLRQPAVRPRRTWLWPALAAVALGMVAGAAFAVTQGGLRALPVVGSLLSPTPAAKPAEARRGHLALPRTPGRDQEGEALAPAPWPQPVPVPAAPLPVAPPAVPEPAPVARPGRALADAQHEPPRALREAAALHPREPAVGRQAEALPASASAEEPIVAESGSFAVVIASWHRQHDAGAALALLDAHEQRYPAGAMRLEARILRAELYLAQGRNEPALSVLDGMSLSGIPRARELQTLRGELRAKAGRCRDAQADLGSVLEKNLTDALARRATQALAHCP